VSKRRLTLELSAMSSNGWGLRGLPLSSYESAGDIGTVGLLMDFSAKKRQDARERKSKPWA